MRVNFDEYLYDLREFNGGKTMKLLEDPRLARAFLERSKDMFHAEISQHGVPVNIEDMPDDVAVEAAQRIFDLVLSSARRGENRLN